MATKSLRRPRRDDKPLELPILRYVDDTGTLGRLIGISWAVVP